MRSAVRSGSGAETSAPFGRAASSLRRNAARPSDVTDALLTSFRPPDRTPPRLGSLSKAQETAVLRFLDVMAHDPASASTDLAMQVLAEWWTPGAISRDEE